jgi:hypothetical protein
MPADLESVRALAQMVRVVNGPTRQPQHLAFEFAKHVELVWRVRFVIPSLMLGFLPGVHV